MHAGTKRTQSHFKDLLNGASINIVAKVLAAALGFISSLLLTRHFGAATIGIIAIVVSIMNIGANFALCGMGTLTLKLIPTFLTRHGLKATKQLFRKLLMLSAINAIIAMIAITLFLSFDSTKESITESINPFLPGFLVISAVGVIICSNTLRGLGDYISFSLLDVIPSLLLLLVVLGSISAGLNNETFIHYYFFIYVGSFILALIMVNRYFQKLEHKQHEPNCLDSIRSSQIYKQAIPMFGISVSHILIQNIDILCIAFYLDQKSVGIYSIYIKLVAFTTFATLAVNSMFAPKVALLYEQNNLKTLRRLAKQTTLLSTAVIASLSTGLLIFHEPILTLYGVEFLLDKATLYILLCTTVLHASFGSVGFFLNMTGQQNIFLKIMLTAVILNTLLNLILIPLSGILGAAVATLITTAVWNTLAMLVIFRKHGYTLFPTRLFA
ncbi:hypothetical protein AB833_25910 [Chromatiales bacterium (ex Bugula neritina AB1)]|nr:hypothetical protein AB833_25910 [Chromatiales bacterium (ex Bugula neritina AB1)]